MLEYMQGFRLLGSLTVDTLGGALDTLGIGHWTLYSVWTPLEGNWTTLLRQRTSW